MSAFTLQHIDYSWYSEHPRSSSRISRRSTFSYVLPVLPTTEDTSRLLAYLECEARHILAKAHIEWPNSTNLQGREYYADQLLWNIHCVRHYMDHGDPMLAMYFGIQAGESAAILFHFRNDERRCQLQGQLVRQKRAGQRSAEKRRTPALRRRALKRYAELRRGFEKVEAAKRQCAQEYKKSRATISRWIKDENDHRRHVLQQFHRWISDGESEESALDRCKKVYKVSPRQLKRWSKDKLFRKSRLTKGS